jgi:hypothetical protein
MVTSQGEYCDHCRRRNVVSFTVEPEHAWPTVVLNRWRRICPSCFDAEAERAGVNYTFANLEAQSWLPAHSRRAPPPPRPLYPRKR